MTLFELLAFLVLRPHKNTPIRRLTFSCHCLLNATLLLQSRCYLPLPLPLSPLMCWSCICEAGRQSKGFRLHSPACASAGLVQNACTTQAMEWWPRFIQRSSLWSSCECGLLWQLSCGMSRVPTPTSLAVLPFATPVSRPYYWLEVQ